MTIAGQLREEAAAIANSRAFEIIEAAQRMLTSSRFARLRKGKVIAQNARERNYINALVKYVDYKMRIRKVEMRFPYSQRPVTEYWYLKKQMDIWRTEMDRIEFNLEPMPGIFTVLSDGTLAEYDLAGELEANRRLSERTRCLSAGFVLSIPDQVKKPLV